jgi:hypothetical protein
MKSTERVIRWQTQLESPIINRQPAIDLIWLSL